ncbi:hypothetical protein [Pseudoalteromonas sp. NJ631]|uniref:hypothetical protein n=1 Tax=Pseudoalteromonas sp. NJ631 TaxID=493915 RepID=UPI0002F22135|nr:hypothetical protein [Pseudoalteromonas sp. NJ631]
MSTSDQIRKELDDLIISKSDLLNLAKDTSDSIKFGAKYQEWYSRAIKLVESLAPERLKEFSEYYLIDPKRKLTNASNYVIQDYVKGIGARTDHSRQPMWDVNNLISIRVMNQVHIIASLASRIDSVLQDVTGHLFAELQDKELEEAARLIKISPRAAGALSGVVLERHLQRTAENHQIKLRKKAPTISDLNDPLKQANVYGVPTWRKIQLLADIRNLCSHQKDEEPTKAQVAELIDGVNSIIKSVF